MGRAASNPSSASFGESTEANDADAPVGLSNAFGNCGACLASSADGSAGMLMTGGADCATSSPATLPPTVALYMELCPSGKCSTGASSGLEGRNMGGKGATCVTAAAGNVADDLFATGMDMWSSADEVPFPSSSSAASVLVINGCAPTVELSELVELLWLVELVRLVELVGLVELFELAELVNVAAGGDVVVMVDVAVVVVTGSSRIWRSDKMKLAAFMSHRGAPSHAELSSQCVSPDHSVTAITKPACIAFTVWATS